jgi:RNA recognition motif-containing protein
MKLYVGNLSYDTTENDLRDAFAPFGTVTEVALPRDRDTDRPRGFAFVSMSNSAEAQAAIKALNGQMLAGRSIKVTDMKER